MRIAPLIDWVKTRKDDAACLIDHLSHTAHTIDEVDY
jgi:hypothetical protein